MIKLITWEMDRSFTPTDAEQRLKLTLGMCDMVKKQAESGVIKVWGMNPGGHGGFGISDKDEKEIFGMTAQYIPYVKFRVEPMLSIDEVIATLKAAQQQA